MFSPAESKIRAVNLVIGLLLQGREGQAVSLANKLKCFLGLSDNQVVEGITRNGDFYQVALRDRLTGKGELYAMGPDGSAWEWGPGGWVPLPSNHPLVGLAVDQEGQRPVLDG
jgi:hypothetical protein